MFLSLHHGDDVLECVKGLVHEMDLQNGVVATGVGSLSAGHFHVIASNNYPGDTHIRLKGPRRSPSWAGSSPAGSPTST